MAPFLNVSTEDPRSHRTNLTMAKTIAVVGSTGGQGGSVARRLLKSNGWNVRGITRNVDGKAAKALAAEGAQVVAANVDDEESLVKAFEVSQLDNANDVLTPIAHNLTLITGGTSSFCGDKLLGAAWTQDCQRGFRV